MLGFLNAARSRRPPARASVCLSSLSFLNCKFSRILLFDLSEIFAMTRRVAGCKLNALALPAFALACVPSLRPHSTAACSRWVSSPGLEQVNDLHCHTCEQPFSARHHGHRAAFRFRVRSCPSDAVTGLISQL